MTTTHCYHKTKKGHEVLMDVSAMDASKPVLITFHGGGIVHGSRTQDHWPQGLQDLWSGVVVGADYRLLVPSIGADIVEDMEALFEFLLQLPINHHQLFVAGFSGGGYPARLAGIVGGRESTRSHPRYTLCGVISYFGMGGDFLLDYWFNLAPRYYSSPDLSQEQRQIEEKMSKEKTDQWKVFQGEVSSSPYEGWVLDGFPERGSIWTYWHLWGTINEAIAGDEQLQARLASISYSDRANAIPERLHCAYPQIMIAKDGVAFPPTFLLHGDKDPVVPYEESLHTYNTLKAAGKDVELVTIEGAGHDLKVNGKFNQAVEDGFIKTIQWIMKHIPASPAES